MPSVENYVEIAISKDGGHTESDPTKHDLGNTGRFQKRVLKTRMGQSRQWMFDIQCSGPFKTDLLAGSIVAELEK